MNSPTNHCASALLAGQRCGGPRNWDERLSINNEIRDVMDFLFNPPPWWNIHLRRGLFDAGFRQREWDCDLNRSTEYCQLVPRFLVERAQRFVELAFQFDQSFTVQQIRRRNN
jgi:hypothetical protein